MLNFIKRFSRDETGVVAIITAILIGPVLVGISGFAIDYARALSVRSFLATVADSTALAVARRRALDADVNVGELKRFGDGYFRQAMQSANFDFDLSALEVQPPGNGTNSETIVSFKAEVNSYFGGLIGMQSLKVAGDAQVAVASPSIDVHLVIDVSSSMGLAATEAEQLQLLNQIGCAFACHASENGNPPTLSVSQSLGISTRLDALKTASVGFVAQMRAAQPDAQIRVAVYAYHNRTRMMSALSSDDVTITNAINALQLGEGLPRSETSAGEPGDTVPSTLSVLEAAVGRQGDGSPTNPQKLVLLVTDGTASSRKPNLVTELFDASVCQPLKDNGVDVGVIYTEYDYVNKDTDSTFQFAIAPIEDQIIPTLQDCASGDLFSNGDEPSEIEQAFTEVWNRFQVGQLRLTR